MKTIYVNCVIVSEDLSKICIIFKKRGHPTLLNKFNFIGGKVKEGETLTQAVKRETLEETGLVLDESKLTQLSSLIEESFELHNFVIKISNAQIATAETMETERVSISDLNSIINEVKELPNKFAPDFPSILSEGLNKVRA